MKSDLHKEKKRTFRIKSVKESYKKRMRRLTRCCPLLNFKEVEYLKMIKSDNDRKTDQTAKILLYIRMSFTLRCSSQQSWHLVDSKIDIVSPTFFLMV